MYKFISSLSSIGLESIPFGIKIAEAAPNGKNPSLIQLRTIHLASDNVKPLYIHHPILTTGISGKEVLIRSLSLPLTKEKDIQEALIFQAEPLLPYPADQAFLAYQIISQDDESTQITLLAVRKEAVRAHLEPWQALDIEPERVSSLSSALCEFGLSYFPNVKTYLILHLQHQEMTCLLIKESKLCASFSQSEGLKLLFDVQAQEGLSPFPKKEEEWRELLQDSQGIFAEGLKRLQKEVIKLGYALSKECKPGTIEGIAITGEAARWEGLSQVLVQNLQLPLLACPSLNAHSSQELLTYAVPIGLALGSLPNRSHCIDFRQEDFAFPHPWKRLKIPVALYFFSICLLSFAFYFFGQQYLSYQENQIKQGYVDFLADMGKAHEDLEIAYASKSSKSVDPASIKIPAIEQLSQEDLRTRLAYLHKELQGSPDSFPLSANIPRLSDFLAWISQHPAAVGMDENGDREAKLQIENFSYTMLKRPQQGKKQEKYQVKIELEFSTSTPKWAREFHDALIAPNEWIDSKGEVKWNSNRGKYKTSFFLKDKTVYPSL